jgi:Tfp pilus assembly protein PilF
VKRWDDFTALAAGDGAFGKIKGVLDGQDAGFAADKSAELGVAFLKSGDEGTARQWLEYGITRDPNDSGLNLLANSLESTSGGRRASRGSR